MPLWGALVALFWTAAVCLLLARFVRQRFVYVALSSGAFVTALVAVLTLWPNMPATATLNWLPSLGVNLTLRMDGLAALFAVLVLGIGLLIVVYAHGYLHPDDPPARFFGALLLFAGAMLGVVLADNLIALCVFWELTSVASFLLIGYWHDRAEARAAAYQALIVTALGGLALLAGILMLGQIGGAFEWSVLVRRTETLNANPWLTPALLLILLGAFTKSAQYPFHFWLPNAMAAPTPVSAYLHSATMVKAGIFLLARLHPMLRDHPLWTPLVGGVGAVTMLWAGYVAVLQRDIKALLAYSTVSQLGFMTALLGLGTPNGMAAALLLLVTHAGFKAALFLVAGIVEHKTHTRHLDELGGLARAMPVVAAITAVAAAALAGVPPLSGYLSKEIAFDAVVHESDWRLAAVVTLASAFTTAYAVRFAWGIFFRPPQQSTAKSWAVPPALWVPAAILSAWCIGAGVMPSLFTAPLWAPALQGAAERVPKLTLWHGFGAPMAMSAIALCGGVALHAALSVLVRWHQRLPAWTGDGVYDALARGLLKGAEGLTNFWQSGVLRRYLWWTVGFAATAVSAVLLPGGWFQLPVVQPVPWATVAMGLVLCGAAVLVAVTYPHRLVAVLGLSVVGVMVIVHFLWLSAPDLALTQLVVEIASLLILLLLLAFLPRKAPDAEPRGRKLADMAFAATIGAGVGALTLSLLSQPVDPTVRNFYLTTAKALAGGRNVVNVIVVDYRGYDTLGEIVVMGIAGLSLYVLMRLRRRAVAPAGAPVGVSGSDRPENPTGYVPSPLLMTLARLILLPGAMVAFYLFWRGHNAPGGGFVAGLVIAGLIALQYIAFGERHVRRALPVNYRALIAWGWLAAMLTGVGAWAMGMPFLTSGFRFLHLPLLGEIELASATLFDLGVLLVVVGVVLMAFSLLGAAYRD